MHEPCGELLGCKTAHDEPVAVAMLELPVQHARSDIGVGGAHQDAPGRALQRGEVVLQHEPAAVEHADARAQRLDLAEQMAGQEDGGALFVEGYEQVAHLADALWVKAVRGFVEHQQPGLAQQRCREPQPLPHAERVGLHRPPPDGVEPHLLEHFCDPGATRAPRSAGPGRVHQHEVAARREMAVGRGPFDERTDVDECLAGPLGHRLAEELDAA